MGGREGECRTPPARATVTSGFAAALFRLTMTMMILICFVVCWSDLALAIRIPRTSAWSPSNPPEMWITTHPGSAPAPAASPKHDGSNAYPPVSRHHKRKPRAFSPSSIFPPQGQDCSEIFCSDPLTLTPIGSPCGCVYPIQVVIDLGVAPFRLFTHIPELEVEVATGTFLKQSQVKIMGADASTRDQEKTTVTIYLVPLGDKFDNMSTLLIFERFWEKKVQIDTSTFGDYEVIYVHYPGLPPSPPSASGGSSGFGPSSAGSQEYPFMANVPTDTSQKMNSRIIAVIVLSSFILILVCCGGAVFLILKCKQPGTPSVSAGATIASSITKRSGIRHLKSSSMASSTSMSFVSTMAACPPSVKIFSVGELEKATERFSSKKILGEGGFGRVYHGILGDGSEVAVKLLTKEHQNKDREFISEVEMLSRLHHRNLIKLIGICIEGHTQCLVYELVRNGSVESHLHASGNKKKESLNWDARMKIALGAARGLAYLHEDSNPRVIHRDFKASNILLEEDFTPKVSDFGLAREASEGTNHISTRVMGTFGYVAPEYAMTGHLLVKSDVYSYGVVLLELLSGRKPVYVAQPQGPENLVTWARPLLTNREGLEQLIDPALGRDYDFDIVAKVAAIASMCVHVEASQRPFMGEVVQALKLIYNETDEANEDSCSQRESSSCPDSEYKDDQYAESSWWNRSTPRLTYGHASSFITMEYSLDADSEMPHSSSSLVGRMESISRLNRSGPLRTKRRRTAFYRLKGSMSEHGHLPRRLSMNE